ncbi:hypothetical protein HDU83_003937 [Entophlyctis luteolus]|nr:hypothetical protein HDU83_003937 [Entophlyctis luteolus]KAJ3385234.1 hypothetical protein HDU84_002388 [Entophlyctis sp. JEL0112]
MAKGKKAAATESSTLGPAVTGDPADTNATADTNGAAATTKKSTTKTRKRAAPPANDGVDDVAAKRRAAAPPPPVVSTRKLVGPHASAAGGAANAVSYTMDVGGACFALFLANQRRWDRPPLTDEAVEAFKAACSEHGIDPQSAVLPHGSYLINVGNPDSDKRKKSLEAFLEDVSRCERLGITLYNFHPGSTVGECTREESIALVASAINEAHSKTKNVTLVIENMAGQGNVLGGPFADLSDLIALVEDKTRVGVCLDTCHMFAAGYDIRTPEKFDAVMKDFDKIVGLKYLKAMHLNDSMADIASHKDRHDFIGKGKIGIEAFRFIMNDDRFNDIPMVLEVPVEGKTEREVYRKEIALLYSLVDTKNGTVATADLSNKAE